MTPGAYTVSRFVDDFGEEVYPYKMSRNTFMARYYFFRGE